MESGREYEASTLDWVQCREVLSLLGVLTVCSQCTEAGEGHPQMNTSARGRIKLRYRPEAENRVRKR